MLNANMTTREQQEAAMRATVVGDQVKYVGSKMGWLENGMIGRIYAQSQRDGKRDVEFANGQAATIRPFDLSRWEAC